MSTLQKFDNPQASTHPVDARLATHAVRKYISFYLILFVVFWVVAIVATYAKTQRAGKTFTTYSMAFNNGYHRFRDFTDFDQAQENFPGPYGLRGNNYPPSLICVFLAFTRFFRNPIRVYLGFEAVAFAIVGLGLAIVLWRLGRNSLLAAAAAIVTIAVGYPFLFVWERGNVEVVIFMLNAAAVTAFVLRRHFLAATGIAIAASMKIFPGALLALLLARKKYREFVWAVAIIIPIEIISLWLIGPTIRDAYRQIRAGMILLGREYFAGYAGPVIGYDHSLFSILKMSLHFIWRDPKQADILNAHIAQITPFYTITVASGFAALYILRIRKLPVLNQIAVLIIAAVTLPYVSFEYTLTHVFLVFAIFVFYLSRDIATGTEQISSRTAFCVLGLLAFLFTPDIYITGGTQIYGGQVKALALVTLAGIFLVTPMESKFLDAY